MNKYIGTQRHKDNLRQAAKIAAQKTKECPSCGDMYSPSGYTNHVSWCWKRKLCVVCGKLNKNPESTTCSYSCSNTLFRSGKDNPNFLGSSYRHICFENHERKCVVCEERLIVEVHHLDENKDNNNSDNLIPLCPTHHQYWHSRYKNLVEVQILEYLNNWKTSRV